MPVRVRCRCGQELVLRYGEWVYFFLGLALLCLVVNMLALLLLYLRIEEISRSESGRALPATAAAHPEGASVPKVPVEPGAARDGESTPSLGLPRSASYAPPLPAPPDAPPPREDPLPGMGPERREGKAEPPRKSDRTERGPLAPLDAPAAGRPESSPAKRALPAGSRPLVSLDAVSDVHWPPGPSSRSAAPVEASVLAPEKPSPWVDEPPLLRLLLLERSSEHELLAPALLSDPDSRLRALALKKIGALSGDSLRDRAAGRWLGEAAWDFLRLDPEGRRVLAALGVEGPAGQGGVPSGQGASFAESIKARLGEACARVLSEPAPRALEVFLAKHEEQGTELVLLLDSSESMRRPLGVFQARADGLLGVLSWALPGIRVGAVIYRDDVELATGFSTGTLAEVAAALRQARPEGGGNVPEGVHLALRAALELGRFDWRPASMKNIVVLGDAPPPYEEVPGLLGLASRAFRQGGYRVHTVGFEPGEGRTAVPFFSELARSGGGRSVTVESGGDAALEVIRTVFPGEALAAVEPLVPALRSLASLGR